MTDILTDCFCIYAVIVAALFLRGLTEDIPFEQAGTVAILWPYVLMISVFEDRLERMCRRWKISDRIVCSLNPATTTRRYEVCVMGHAFGYVRHFWRLSSAQKFYESVREAAPRVELADEWRIDPNSNSPLILSSQNNREKFPAPPPRGREPGYFHDAVRPMN